MNLPSVIIGIILSALAVGIGAVYYGDAFTDGSASATAATLSSQAAQINDAVDTYRAENAGQNPADIATLISDGYLESMPKTSIADGDWALATVNGNDQGVTQPLTGDASNVCEEAQDAAGHANPDTFVTGLNVSPFQDGESTPNDKSNFLYGCTDGGASSYTFYRQ